MFCRISLRSAGNFLGSRTFGPGKIRELGKLEEWLQSRIVLYTIVLYEILCQPIEWYYIVSIHDTGESGIFFFNRTLLGAPDKKERVIPFFKFGQLVHRMDHFLTGSGMGIPVDLYPG